MSLWFATVSTLKEICELGGSHSPHTSLLQLEKRYANTILVFRLQRVWWQWLVVLLRRRRRRAWALKKYAQEACCNVYRTSHTPVGLILGYFEPFYARQTGEICAMHFMCYPCLLAAWLFQGIDATDNDSERNCLCA